MEQIAEIKQFLRAAMRKNPYEMFSIDEAAVAFNISKKRITQALNEKEMPEFRLDKKQRMIRRKDIESWIDSKEKLEIPLIRSKDFQPVETPKSKRGRKKSNEC